MSIQWPWVSRKRLIAAEHARDTARKDADQLFAKLDDALERLERYTEDNLPDRDPKTGRMKKRVKP